MYALVDIKGKQYKAEKGSLLRIDKLNNVKGDVVEFDSVLMTSDNDDIKIGNPYVKGMKIKAVVEDQIKDKKVVAVTPRPEFKPFFDLQYEGLSHYVLHWRPRGGSGFDAISQSWTLSGSGPSRIVTDMARKVIRLRA